MNESFDKEINFSLQTDKLDETKVCIFGLNRFNEQQRIIISEYLSKIEDRKKKKIIQYKQME